MLGVSDFYIQYSVFNILHLLESLLRPTGRNPKILNIEY